MTTDPSRPDRRSRFAVSAPARYARRRLAAWTRFSTDRRGATAVEFAILMVPFVTLVFAIIELSLIFLATLTLEDATAIAARQMRVNPSNQASGISNQTSVNAFRTAVCNNMGWLSQQCLTGLSASGNQFGLVVDVRDPSSFSSATMTEPVKNGVLAQYDGTKCFLSGTAGDIVVMRIFFPWQMFTPFLNNAFVRLSNGSIVLSDTEVFTIEPPPAGTSPTAPTTSC